MRLASDGVIVTIAHIHGSLGFIQGDNIGSTSGNPLGGIAVLPSGPSAPNPTPSYGNWIFSGFVGGATATFDLATQLSAGTKMGDLTAGTLISGRFATNGGDVGIIESQGTISAYIPIVGNIPKVTAKDGITGSITSTGGLIRTVESKDGSIDASISGDDGVKEVIAGQNIGGSISSSNSYIGKVIAGLDGPSSIMANISAERSILLINALGRFEAQQYQAIVDWMASNETADTMSDFIDFMTGVPVAGLLNPTIAEFTRPDSVETTNGNITGTIHAGRNMYQINAGGDVSGAITAGGLVNIEALGDVTSNITSDDGAIIIHTWKGVSGDLTSKTGATVSAYDAVTGTIDGGEGGVEVTNWSTIQADITAGGLVSIHALGDVTGSINSTDGGVEIVTFGKVNVTSIDSKDDIDLLAVLSTVISDRVQSGAGSMRAISRSLSTTFAQLHGDFYVYSFEAVRTDPDARNVSITTWSSYTGHITAENAVRVNALGAVTLTQGGVVAGGRVTVKGDFISGDIITNGSTTGTNDIPNVEVRSWHGFGGNITGARNVTVYANEDVSGAISAAGDLNVFAGGDIDVIGGFVGGAHNGETVSTQAAQTVVAYGSIMGDSITAGTNLCVMGFQGIDVDSISVVGSNDPLPGEHNLDLNVLTQGQLTANLSSKGDIDVFARLGFTGTVSGLDDVSIASYGNVVSSSFAVTEASPPPELSAEEISNLSSYQQDLRAHNVRISAAGNVSFPGGLAAPDNVGIDAQGNISGDITTTRGNVSITANVQRSESSADNPDNTQPAPPPTVNYASTNYTGSITAGGGISVVTSGSVDAGTLTGAGVSIMTNFGGVTADKMTANKGNVGISSGAQISIGGSSSGSGSTPPDGEPPGATGTTTAGQDLYFTSLGVTGGVYQAPRDVVVFSAQVLTGSVDAGRDAVAIGLTTTQLPVTAGQNAFVFSGGDQQGPVTGGVDAVLVALGTVSGSIVTAGQSALLYAVGSVTTASVVGLDAALVSWDSVGGPPAVTGTISAFAFTYGDFYGTVSSPAGDAGLVTYGNAFATTVSGALSAIALTVGNFSGNVTGGTFAGAISLTDFQGNVTSGGGAVLLTEGDGSAHLTAANDAFVWSLSDFDGVIDADREAGAVTYGNLNANIHAGRDIVGAAAVGSITGSLAADNNIGNLLTYGEMAASVQAVNPNSVTGGGAIGDVVAWGPISGSITAGSTIGNVRSASEITGSIAAPIIGSITPFDSTVMVDNPLPVTPVSIKADVQADGATAYAGVLADKTQFESDRTTFLSDMVQDKQDTADDITQSQSDIVALNAADLIANQNDLAVDKTTAESQITVEQLDVESDYQAMSQTCATGEAEFQEALNDSLTVNALAWIASANDADASRSEADLAFSNSLGQRSGALDRPVKKLCNSSASRYPRFGAE